MPDKPDHEKIKKALKAAGVIIPDDPHLRDKFSAELSKLGVKPNLTLLANEHWVLVMPD